MQKIPEIRSSSFIKRVIYVMHQKYFLKKELAKRYKVSVSTIERWVYLKTYLLLE